MHSEDVISRLHHIDDDGHAIKLGRAAGVGHHISKAYEGKGRLPLEGDEVWMKVFHLIVDSVQTPGPTWVRTAGLDEAWKVSFVLDTRLLGVDRTDTLL